MNKAIKFFVITTSIFLYSGSTMASGTSYETNPAGSATKPTKPTRSGTSRSGTERSERQGTSRSERAGAERPNRSETARPERKGSSRNFARRDKSIELNKVQIQLIQLALKDLGYNSGAIDGEWRQSSAAAVMQYQASLDQTQTGTLTARTACGLIAISVKNHGYESHTPSWCGLN